MYSNLQYLDKLFWHVAPTRPKPFAHSVYLLFYVSNELPLTVWNLMPTKNLSVMAWLAILKKHDFPPWWLNNDQRKSITVCYYIHLKVFQRQETFSELVMRRHLHCQFLTRVFLKKEFNCTIFCRRMKSHTLFWTRTVLEACTTNNTTQKSHEKCYFLHLLGSL